MNRSTVRRAQALAVGLAVATAVPAIGLAQGQAPVADTLPRYNLEGITVSVTRSEVPRAALPQKIDVITVEDLDRTASNDVAEVLKKHAAVDVIQYPGLLSGVGIRGFRPQFSGINQRTLVLIDGRPAGTTNLALIDLADVERIEVLKGPASALYGSSAMGGVVNIVTRRSAGSLASTVTLGYGSFDTYQGVLQAGGNLTQALDFDLALSLFEQNADYRVGSGNLLRDWVGDGTATRTLTNGSTVVDPDTANGDVRPFSQYGTYSGSLRLGYEIDDRWRVDARGERFVADGVQNPGDLFAPFPSRSLKNVGRSAGEIGLAGALDRHALSARVFAAAEDAEYFNRPDSSNFVSFRSPIRWYGGQVQDVVQLGVHSVTAGVDYTSVNAESEFFSAPGTPGAPFSPNSGIHSRAAFAEGRFAFLDERLVGTLGGRLDRITFDVKETELLTSHTANKESYTVFNPSFGLQYRTLGGLRLHGTGGRAFVAPDAFNVAGYAERRSGAKSISLTRGNPDLKPENSFTWDVGLGLFRPGMGLEADVTYFQTDVRDRITSERSVPTAPQLTATGDTIQSITTYINADQAEIRGLEWRASYDLGAFANNRYALRLFTNATQILRAEEFTTRGGATTAADIRNVADLTLNYGIEYDDLQRFSTRLSGRYVGERSDMDFNDWTNPADVRYPEFMVLDFATSLRLRDRYRIGLLVGTLTDENYYEVRGYPLPGRTVQLRLGVDF